MRSIQARLSIAETAARNAGEVLADFYTRRGSIDIEMKGPNDFVSVADRQAELCILNTIAEHFPNDRFIGEETGVSGTPDGEFQWCIDPLDGTTNFLKGAHNWCVSIGLLLAGHPVAGVVYDPVRQEMFEGGVGLGARCNGMALRVSGEADPARSTIGIGHVSRIPVGVFCGDTASLLGAGFSFRQVGAGALMLAYVAAGRIDAYFERHMWPWDAVAGLALIGSAGGRFLPYIGSEVGKGGMVLAANEALMRKAMAVLHVE